MWWFVNILLADIVVADIFVEDIVGDDVMVDFLVVRVVVVDIEMVLVGVMDIVVLYDERYCFMVMLYVVVVDFVIGDAVVVDTYN